MHENEVASVMRPHGVQPTRLLRPWDFPGKSAGVGCRRLLRWLTQRRALAVTSHNYRCFSVVRLLRIYPLSNCQECNIVNEAHPEAHYIPRSMHLELEVYIL